MMKRFLVFLLAMAAMAPAARVMAERCYACFYQGTLTFYFDDKRDSRDGLVFVVSDYEDIGWDDIRSSITAVDFDASFKKVSLRKMYRWFDNCSNLAEVLHPENVNTTATTTAGLMFSGCAQLAAIDVSTWFASGALQDAGGMFSGCTALESIDMSNWNVTNVAHMAAMFSGCAALQSVVTDGWDTGNVTDMDRMFYQCESLESLDVGGWNTANVTDMAEMFEGCTALRSVDVSGWNTASVTDMGRMFYQCESLASLNVSLWNTACVTDMAEMFRYCYKLKELNVKRWDTAKVTDMKGMFHHCSALQSLDVEGWDTGSVTDMSDMFCALKLASLNLSKWNTAKVTDMSSMFMGGLWEVLDLGSWNTALVTDMNHMFHSCQRLTTIYCDNGFRNFDVNSEWMFTSCPNLAGGKGTAFSEDFVDVTYARPDGGAANPGYFTERYILIDSDHFPDAKFREELMMTDIGADGKLTRDEILETTRLEIVRTGEVADLQGIGFFTELGVLVVTGNRLQWMDLYKNKKLSQVWCAQNQLYGEDMTGTAISLPQVDNGLFYVLGKDDSGVRPEANEMTPEQVSAANERGWAVIVYDENEGRYTPTQGFWRIGEERFPDENFRACLNSSGLRCAGVLTAEDEPDNINAEGFGIEDFTGIEYFPALTSLYIAGNKVKGEGMDFLVNHLPTVSGGRIAVYDGHSDSYAEGNEMTPEQVSVANGKGWEVVVFDEQARRYETTQGFWLLGEERFPDANFRSYLAGEFGRCTGALTYEEAASCEEMTPSCRNIEDLTGIEYFTALYNLDVSGNKLASLDILKNTNLHILSCETNKLKGNDMATIVAELPNIASGDRGILYTYDNSSASYTEGNEITPGQVAAANRKGWDVYVYDESESDWVKSKGLWLLSEERFPDANFRSYLAGEFGRCTGALTYEEAASCEEMTPSCRNIEDLTGIEYFTALYNLDVSGNKLASLDMSDNPNIHIISCEANQLKLKGMTDFIASLPTYDSDNPGSLYIYNDTNASYPEGNIATPEHIDMAKAKGWIVYVFDPSAGKSGDWVEYDGSQYTAVQENGQSSMLNAQCLMLNGQSAYDLQGRKLNGQLPKGIYIVGGKKVMVK